MGDLLDLANRLEKRIVEIEKEANEIGKRTAILILTDLLTTTPVDTTKAQSNWRVSLNDKPTTTISAYYPGFSGYTAGKSAAAALAAAKAVLIGKKIGDKIYISNVSHYIVKLNEGSSKQEPAGFAERAVLIGRNYVSKAKVLK